MECAICYDVCPKTIKCADYFCTCRICNDCLSNYLDVAVKESLLPICIGTGCQAPYLFEHVEPLSVDLSYKFQAACYNNQVQQNKGKIDENARQKQVIEDLRNERTKYLRTTFPIAIRLVAEITCKSNLNRVKIEKVKNNFGRICMNSFCPGTLGQDLVCTLCSSKFCEKCEMLILKDHQCRSEDLESVNLAKSLPQCPNCGLHLAKDKACDHVRCGVCGTKFIYGTDKLGGSGGHTKMVEITTKQILSTKYQDELPAETLQALVVLEQREPKPPSYAPVLNVVKKLLTQQIIDKKKLVVVLDGYHKGKQQCKRYARYMIEVEKSINQKKLTPEMVRSIIQVLSVWKIDQHFSCYRTRNGYYRPSNRSD